MLDLPTSESEKELWKVKRGNSNKRSRYVGGGAVEVDLVNVLSDSRNKT